MLKTKYLVIFLAFLVLGMTVAVAADVDDSTSTTKKVTKDTTKIAKNTAVTKKATKTTDKKTTTKAKETTKQVANKTNEQKVKEITKKTNVKNVKTCIPINNSNFDEYFTSTGFGSNVQDNACFTFTENIVRNGSYVVDKAVNINGNGNRIELNTVSGDYNGTESGNSFNITGSFINITNLKFYNSQVFVKNAHHVTMDNINVTVNNQRIGSGVGVTSIRENSSYITVKNSYFYTCNNSGSSTLVIADADYCTIDNNTITGEGNVGNLIYLTTYNIPGVSYTNVNINTYNNITNNRISAINLTGGVCVGVVVSGHSNKFEGNNVSVPSAFAGQWISPFANLTGDFNDTYEGNSYIANDVNGSFTGTKNSTITGNTFHGTVSLPERCIFKNNNAENVTVSVKGANCDLCGNRINTLVVSAFPIYVCRDNYFVNPPTYPDISWYNHGAPHGVSDLNGAILNKKQAHSIKSDDGSEVTVATIDDDESFFQWFNDQGIIKSDVINTDMVYNLYYVPSSITRIGFDIMGPDWQKGMLYNFTVVGKKDVEFKNILVSASVNCIVFSNLTFVYDEEYTQSQIFNVQPGDENGNIILDNIVINVNTDRTDFKNIFYSISYAGNVTLQNSVINAKVPSIEGNSQFSGFEAVCMYIKNSKIINNTINLEEEFAVSENSNIIGIGLHYSNNYYHANNTIIKDNNINIQGTTVYGIKIIQTGNHTIEDNKINVTGQVATTIEINGDDNTIQNNLLLANDKKGDETIIDSGSNNVYSNNEGINTNIRIIAPETVNVNEITPITVVLTDDKGNLLDNQEINVTAGEDSEIIKTENGIAIYELLPTTSGSLDIIFNYEGALTVLASNKTITVTVNEDKDAIIEELNKTVQEQKETIASQEEDIEDLNNIIEEQDDEIESLTNTTQALNNTVAQLEKDIKDVQEQIANNNNTINGNGSSNKTSTPIKTSVTLKVNPTTIYTGSKTKITATLKDANGKAVASQKITLKVGTKTYTVKTNKKGVATKSVKVTKTGKNKVTATFKATKKYAKATKSATVTVKAKEKTKITVSKLSYKNKKITIKATIKAGKKALTQNTKLTIKVDGKTLTSKKISKKGKISLTLKKALKNGSHKVQIISKATSMYKQSKVTKTLKV